MRTIFFACQVASSSILGQSASPKGIYICIEQIFFLVTGVILSIFFTRAVKIIFKDRNNYLDQMDRLLFCNAFLQIICISLYFFIAGNLFMLSTIRTSRIIQELFICLIFIQIVMEESSNNEKLMRIILGILVVIIFIWFCGGILMKSEIDWICGSKILLIYSTELIIINAVSLYFGVNSIEKVKQSASEVPSSYLHSIYTLMTVGFISSLIQFLYDYLAHIMSKKIDDCFSFYLPNNIIKFFLLVLWKICIMIIPPMTIYFLFYHKNKDKFNIRIENKMRFSVFDENRSNFNDESDINEVS